jgi:hypothetical protein
MPGKLTGASSRAAIGIRNVANWIGTAGRVDDVEWHEQRGVGWSALDYVGRLPSRWDPAPPAHAMRVVRGRQSLRPIGDQLSKRRNLLSCRS